MPTASCPMNPRKSSTMTLGGMELAMGLPLTKVMAATPRRATRTTTVASTEVMLGKEHNHSEAKTRDKTSDTPKTPKDESNGASTEGTTQMQKRKPENSLKSSSANKENTTKMSTKIKTTDSSKITKTLEAQGVVILLTLIHKDRFLRSRCFWA